MWKRLLDAWRAAPRPAVLGLFLFFCAGFADGALVPFFPLWAKGAGIPVAAIGLLFGCYAGGELLAAPLIGGIADRLGRRPVVIAAALGVGAGIACLFFVHGVWATALVLVATGICESVLHPTILTAIGDVTGADQHRHWFSLARMSAGAGQIAGPAIGAALTLISLPAVFLASGGVLFVGGVIAWAMLAETRGPAHGDADDADDEEGLGALLPAFRDGRLARLLGWVVLFEVAGSWIESVIPLYAHDAGSLTAAGVGRLFAYAGVLTVLLQLAINRLTAARSPALLTLAAGVVTALAFVALASSPAVGSLVLAVSLCALAQMLIGPQVPAMVHALAAPSRRAAYMAASSVAVDLKDSLGPSLGTALYAVAPRLPWFLGVPLVAAASFGLAGVLKRHADQGSTTADGHELRVSVDATASP